MVTMELNILVLQNVTMTRTLNSFHTNKTKKHFKKSLAKIVVIHPKYNDLSLDSHCTEKCLAHFPIQCTKFSYLHKYAITIWKTKKKFSK